MSLSLHANLAPLQVLDILTVATKTLFKGNPRVKSNYAVRIGEASITNDTIRIASSTIDLVSDRLGLIVG